MSPKDVIRISIPVFLELLGNRDEGRYSHLLLDRMPLLKHRLCGMTTLASNELTVQNDEEKIMEEVIFSGSKVILPEDYLSVEETEEIMKQQSGSSLSKQILEYLCEEMDIKNRELVIPYYNSATDKAALLDLTKVYLVFWRFVKINYDD
jgi:hypothetical protein